jgi:GNAT superfamily N-acetyltransferase
MKSEVSAITQRLKRVRIGLKETLAVIDMTLEDHRHESEGGFPYEVFEGLDDLIDRTVRGTKIERFKPKEGHPMFHTFEIHANGGDILGYLNTIYLRKPLPCYYLVYVEVLPHFRGRGLGNRILQSFGEFAENTGALGLLDNIILPEEPTYNIYTNLGWKRIQDFMGGSLVNGEEHYMVFLPTSCKIPDLQERLIKLLLKVKKKRPVIEMHDNESMVKRTIAEFRSVYEALEDLFDVELSTGTSTPFMRFMFTKFVTKVLGFRRRIAALIGYTGGESLEQISISDRIKALPIQPYSLWGSEEGRAEVWGEEGMIRSLPEQLKKEPTLYIEDLPLYRRPYLLSFMRKKGVGQSYSLEISDLLELGFDPTKLREFGHEGVDYIFERISPLFLPSIEKRIKWLKRIAEPLSRIRFHNATLQTNPPLAILQDRGNVYVLRKKVKGIHLEEALDQLRTSPHLNGMNRAAGIDHALVSTVNEIKSWTKKAFHPGPGEEIEDLAFFIPWELERNIPRIQVDISGISLESLWIA